MMTPFDTQPTKRKNRSPLRVIVNAWGCLLGALMLGLGIVVGLAGAILFASQLLGFDATATMLAEREIVLAATQADLNQRDRDANQRATDMVRDNLATIAALNNAAALLDQTATQSANNIIATATANAAENARQRTQIALDFTATQARFEQNATQIQLDFQNTQAALGGDFESQSVATAAPTETSTVMLPPPSDTPSMTPLPRMLEADFREGIAPDEWQFESEHWEQDTRGMQAQVDGAWLLSRDTWQDEYTMTVGLAPAVALQGTYTIVVYSDDNTTLAVYLETSGLAVEQVQLVQFAEPLPFISADTKQQVIAAAAVEEPLTSATQITVRVSGSALSVQLNGKTLLTAELPDNLADGAIGVQLPTGAILQTLTVREP